MSQAVDLDHPRSLDFLRADCQHCNDFFRRQGVAVLTNRELFDFAVDPTITDGNIDEVLDALKERAASRPIERTAEEEASAILPSWSPLTACPHQCVAFRCSRKYPDEAAHILLLGLVILQVKEAVFQQAYIPTRMDDVLHYERDHNRAQAGENLEDRGQFYQTIMGLNADMSGPRVAPAILREVKEEQEAAAALKPTSEQGADPLSTPLHTMTSFPCPGKPAFVLCWEAHPLDDDPTPLFHRRRCRACSSGGGSGRRLHQSADRGREP